MALFYAYVIETLMIILRMTMMLKKLVSKSFWQPAVYLPVPSSNIMMSCVLENDDNNFIKREERIG